MSEIDFAKGRGLPGSAWETWREAGAAFARECLASKVSVAPLGEAAFRYAASRGLPHQEEIRRAFIEGYRDSRPIELNPVSALILGFPRD